MEDRKPVAKPESNIEQMDGAWLIAFVPIKGSVIGLRWYIPNWFGHARH